MILSSGNSLVGSFPFKVFVRVHNLMQCQETFDEKFILATIEISPAIDSYLIRYHKMHEFLARFFLIILIQNDNISP